nr:MAG TPA: hypothetical protein [Caudoviricetes sp.]
MSFFCPILKCTNYVIRSFGFKRFPIKIFT